MRVPEKLRKRECQRRAHGRMRSDQTERGGEGGERTCVLRAIPAERTPINAGCMPGQERLQLLYKNFNQIMLRSNGVLVSFSKIGKNYGSLENHLDMWLFTSGLRPGDTQPELQPHAFPRRNSCSRSTRFHTIHANAKPTHINAIGVCQFASVSAGPTRLESICVWLPV